MRVEISIGPICFRFFGRSQNRMKFRILPFRSEWKIRVKNLGQKFGPKVPEVCPTLFGSFSAETPRPKISCYSESARIVAEIGRLRPLSEPFSTENCLSKNSEMIPLFAWSDLWCNEIQFSNRLNISYCIKSIWRLVGEVFANDTINMQCVWANKNVGKRAQIVDSHTPNYRQLKWQLFKFDSIQYSFIHCWCDGIELNSLDSNIWFEIDASINGEY